MMIVRKSKLQNADTCGTTTQTLEVGVENAKKKAIELLAIKAGAMFSTVSGRSVERAADTSPR